MDPDEVLTSLINLPGAHYLGQLASKVPKDSQSYSIAQWMLTGNNPPDFPKGWEGDQLIGYLVDQIIFYVPIKDLSPLGAEIFQAIKDSPHANEIFQKANVLYAFWLTMHRKSGLANFLVTGKGYPGIDYIYEMIKNPSNVVDKIVQELDLELKNAKTDDLPYALEKLQNDFPEEVKIIRDYFYPVPPAPDAPYVSFAKLIGQ